MTSLEGIVKACLCRTWHTNKCTAACALLCHFRHLLQSLLRSCWDEAELCRWVPKTMRLCLLSSSNKSAHACARASAPPLAQMHRPGVAGTKWPFLSAQIRHAEWERNSHTNKVSRLLRLGTEATTQGTAAFDAGERTLTAEACTYAGTHGTPVRLPKCVRQDKPIGILSACCGQRRRVPLSFTVACMCLYMVVADWALQVDKHALMLKLPRGGRTLMKT